MLRELRHLIPAAEPIKVLGSLNLIRHFQTLSRAASSKSKLGLTHLSPKACQIENRSESNSIACSDNVILPSASAAHWDLRKLTSDTADEGGRRVLTVVHRNAVLPCSIAVPGIPALVSQPFGKGVCHFLIASFDSKHLGRPDRYTSQFQYGRVPQRLQSRTGSTYKPDRRVGSGILT